MTTIVACAVDGIVYMAADSCTNVYERPIINGARKIVRVSAGVGEALIGCCGAGGLVDVIGAGLKLPAVPGPGDDAQAWAHAVAVAVTELAVEAGLTEGGALDGHLLLGWNGRLWTLTHSMAIPHPDGRAALGSGEGPGIGALDALLDRGVLPAAAVVAAADIGCRRDRYSEPPLQFEQLSPVGDDAGEVAPS